MTEKKIPQVDHALLIIGVFIAILIAYLVQPDDTLRDLVKITVGGVLTLLLPKQK